MIYKVSISYKDFIFNDAEEALNFMKVAIEHYVDDEPRATLTIEKVESPTGEGE